MGASLVITCPLPETPAGKGWQDKIRQKENAVSKKYGL
jgi:hypothetical protein